MARRDDGAWRAYVLGYILLVTILSVCAASLNGCARAEEAGTDSTNEASQGSSPRFVEIYRTPDDTRLWQSWVTESSVVWMESLGSGSTAALGYFPAPQYGISLKYRNWQGGPVQLVPGSMEQAPPAPRASASYELVLPICWAWSPKRTPDGELRVFWSLPPIELEAEYAFRGIRTWSAGGEPTSFLPESVRVLSPTASGDALAVPVVGGTKRDGNSTGLGQLEDLLMITGNMSAPLSVNPSLPKLPGFALAGLSPYFSFGGRGNGDKSQETPEIIDLRTGRQLDLAIPAGANLVIGGRWAAWSTMTSSSKGTTSFVLHLADLDSLVVEEVTSVGSVNGQGPAFAVSEEWLVVLAPRGGEPTASAGDTYQDLRAYHLPDLNSTEVTSAVAPGEVASVQISGNIVLLTVSPALSSTPHDEPEWVSLRVADLTR